MQSWLSTAKTEATVREGRSLPEWKGRRLPRPATRYVAARLPTVGRTYRGSRRAEGSKYTRAETRIPYPCEGCVYLVVRDRARRFTRQLPSASDEVGNAVLRPPRGERATRVAPAGRLHALGPDRDTATANHDGFIALVNTSEVRRLVRPRLRARLWRMVDARERQPRGPHHQLVVLEPIDMAAEGKGGPRVTGPC